MDWASIDWTALDRLRAVFLSGAPPGACYWQSRADLASYDFTFARRIAWKWDAVLRELDRRGWRPRVRSVLDWGCGSGMAARRVVEFFGPERFDVARFHDQSPLATQFAAEAMRTSFPALGVEAAAPAWLSSREPAGLVLLSHVLSELDAASEAALAQWLPRADAVLWVEPGTRELSRRLQAWRESLRAHFTVRAPCTHAAPCGLLTPGNERHWCHHFATPPPGLMADSNWVRFARRAGLDLRSLPYSFLVLEKPSLTETAAADHAAPVMSVAGYSRIIGRPRFYKGYAKIFSCQADGVRDLTLRKRSAPALFKQLEKDGEGRLYQWQFNGECVEGGHRLGAAGE